MIYAFILIPILYGGIQLLEMSAILARVSGIQSSRRMLGYSVQNSVYMMTRLLIVFLLPLLGFIVDLGISRPEYTLITHASLAAAGVGAVLVYFGRKTIVSYYGSVMESYVQTGRFIRSFFYPAFARVKASDDALRIDIRSVVASREALRIAFMSTTVNTIYSVGMFFSFYLALVYFDYRTTISQLSGVINAFGAVLLTFFIEPLLSRRIDEEHQDASSLVMAVLLGRAVAVLVSGHLFFFLLLLVADLWAA